MGLGELPRATFRGFTYWNPSTMNNNDQQPNYDPGTATLNWPWLERHGLRGEADFDRYVTTTDVLPQANDAINQVDFTAPPAEWNFYGDNTCGFVQPNEPTLEWPAKFSKPAGGTTITGFVNDAGKRVTSNDPWIRQPLRLNAGLAGAKLVDVDPTAPWSSQLFADSVTLGTSDVLGFSGATAGRAHSRWAFFSRNLNLTSDVIIAGVASAMWQLALPTDGLTIHDDSPKAGSLAALLKAALGRATVQGLLVRFVTYHTVYFQGSAFKVVGAPDWKAICDLYADYAQALATYERGDTAVAPPCPINRAYSNTVGWIGPWLDTDMRSAPSGRILYNLQPVIPPGNTTMSVPLGPAEVVVVPDATDVTKVARIAIDLGSTIPELDSTLQKLSLGPMQLAFGPGNPAKATPFATIPYASGYDQATYELTSGVLDIPASAFLRTVSVADLDAGLQLLVGSTVPGGPPQAALAEAEYTAETEDRGVYVNEPGARWSPADPTVVVQVRRHGGKPPAGTQLNVGQYSPWPPMFNELSWLLVAPEGADQDKQPTPYVTMAAQGMTDGPSITVPVPTVVDGLPYATVEVGLKGRRPGPSVLLFVAGPSVPTPPAPTFGFPQLVNLMFANVRVLPYHNAMAASYENWLRGGPSVDLATQRLYDAVFRTFALMYPAMRFLGDPLRFQAQRGRILDVTDPARFEQASYMPVTRPLSAGQRAMLLAWSGYLDGTLATRPKPQERPRGRRA